MDVVRLGLPYTTEYKPDLLIEGWSSMIWTERFQEFGDFELRTPLVLETMRDLPEDTLISHLKTGEVMIVENREITMSAEGHYELVVTGRSLTSFLEHRHLEGKYKKRRPLRKAYSPTGAAAVLLYNSIDNNTGKDVTREDDYVWNETDRLPNVSITDSVPVDGSTEDWFVREGPMFPQLDKILTRGDLWVRTIRPSGTDATIIKVRAFNERGDIDRTWTTDIQSLRFDLYKGLDRSHQQSVNPRVSFNYIHGDIEAAKYLFSIKDYKTACEVMSEVGGWDIYRNDTQKAFSGLKRRVMSIDFGEPEYPDKPVDPGKNATQAQNNKYEEDLAVWRNRVDNIDTRFKNANAKDAETELRKRRKVSVFTGTVSPYAMHEFNRDYYLGDTVTMYGDFDQTETMIVTEYTIAEDAEGERSYPGLIMA